MRILIVMVLLATLGLSACGQMGPLYLPDQKPVAHTNVNQQNAISTKAQKKLTISAQLK